MAGSTSSIRKAGASNRRTPPRIPIGRSTEPRTVPGGRGGSFLLVYDANGDKLNDVITGYDAHGFGFGWF